MARNCRLFLGTPPDVNQGMTFGGREPAGTRYRYRHGIMVDEVWSTGEFHVFQSGRPTKRLGTAKSLREAERLACQKAEE